jgi:hypothetical protein
MPPLSGEVEDLLAPELGSSKAAYVWSRHQSRVWDKFPNHEL